MIRWLLTLSVLWVAASARADTYERQRTGRLMESLGFEEEASPEGKRIAWVRVERDDVFVKDEIWPTWPNLFHGTTREKVVRRELLFAAGETYRIERIEESMRNLRGIGIFALIRIVPVRVPERPDEVGVLVHTRDIWSLRFETGFEVSNFIEKLVANMVERNAFGHNKTVGVGLTVAPHNYILTQSYYARRVLGSTWSLTERVGAVVNRQSDRPEGSVWLLKLGQPYFNLRQRFAWTLSFDYQDYVARRRIRDQVRTIDTPNVGPELPDPKLAWRQRDLLSSLTAAFRWGDTLKISLAGGLDARRVYSRPNAETQLAPELENYFRSVYLPRQRTEVGPVLSYEMWTATYEKFENLSSYGMTENVRVGPTATLTTRLPLSAFGSNSDSWVIAANAGYVYGKHDTLMDGQIEGRTRLEAGEFVEQRLTAVLRGATPVLLRTFRLVARSAIELRRRDTANTFVALGASNGLRGYQSQQVGDSGASRFLTNIELRTLPIEWQAVHVGVVLFYDVGSVYRELSTARLYHAVGAGLRVLFPHLNRTPFIFDGGLSWDPRTQIVPTISSKQVVPLTAADDADD